MALTQGAWTRILPSKKANHIQTIIYCDVTATTAENDAYTLPIPIGWINPKKKFTIFVNTVGATLDAVGLPVDIWAGFSDDFVIAGDGATVAATDGALLLNAAIADASAAATSYVFDPENTAGAGPCPTYAINLDGASTLNAATCRFVIVQ